MKVKIPFKINYIFPLLVILFFSQNNYSQSLPFWSNVRFGGNIGVGFSNDTFNGVIAPSAIYEFNPFVSLGFGLNFGYTDSKKIKATNYGASLISLFNPFPEIQLSAEFEEMGVSQVVKLNGANIHNDYWYPSLFIGAAYRNRGVSIGLRYDVLYDTDKSIYGSAYVPFIRVFF